MFRPVLLINGCVLSFLGLGMLLPALMDMYDERSDWSPFLTSALLALGVGSGLFLLNRFTTPKISIRTGYLATLTSWLSVAFFAAVPFYLSGAFQDIPSALFESFSGVTGTGATVLTDVESQARSVLLWRSMLNALGGIGIVVFAVAVLPFLGIGGMQVFQRENTDPGDKFMPHFVDIVQWIIGIYLSLTLLCALLLMLCGMGRFDALNHAMTAVATGGFSTKNDSVAGFDSVSVELVLSVFMLLGALPMTFYILLIRRQAMDILRLEQVKSFLRAVVFLAAFVTLWLYFQRGYDIFRALRQAWFNVISVITTTGYASSDYLNWGIGAGVFFALLAFHGGCVGSTTGAIKEMRWQVLWSYFNKTFLNAIEPNRIVPVKAGSAVVSDDVVGSVFGFVCLFFVSAALAALCMGLSGYDFATSFSTAAALITNTGPGFIGATGPMGNYALLSPHIKLLMCFVMLLGRLEILTVLVIFSRSFWKS